MSKVGLGGEDSSPMWVRNRYDLIHSSAESPDYLENHENEFQEQGEISSKILKYASPYLKELAF